MVRETPQLEPIPAVYRVPENLPARIAWHLSSVYRLRPGDGLVFQPSDDAPYSAVLHYASHCTPDLESITPFLEHVSGPAYHQQRIPAPASVSRARPRPEAWRLRAEG